MTPIVWAVVGLLAGLVVMWLALRFLAIQPQKTRADSLQGQVATLERERQKAREETTKAESRLEYRDREAAEMKERLAKQEGQLREREQARAAAEAQV